MELRSAARTDVGRRRQANEDSFAVEPVSGLYLVADGLGGHTAGQVASGLAAQAVVNALATLEGTTATLSEKLRIAVTAANREVFSTAESKRELAGMGTTLVALLARGERVALAHVGDSRAYLVRSGKIRQLTHDHSLVAELVRRREIPAHAAHQHPHRHVLTRALGVRRTVEPDLAELTPVAGDLFVLCSDGLTGHVGDEEIATEVSRDPDLDAACGRLVDLANSRGGEDNITLVVVACDQIAG
jgi:protein phosphatase